MTADHVLLDLLPGALEGRADALALLDIFGVATQDLDHFAAAGVAEIFTHNTAQHARMTIIPRWQDNEE